MSPMTGNGGTAMGDKVTNVAIGVSDFAKLTEFAAQHNVSLYEKTHIHTWTCILI